MPYPITESGGKYYVNGKGYDTKAEAERYQAALYANVPDAKKSAQGNTGAMLALFLPEDAAQALYAQVAPTLIEAGVQEPVAPEDYHLTLVLLGEASVIVDSYEPLINAIQALGDEDVARSSLSGQVNGIGRLATSENGETQPIYASFDAVDLPAFRHQLMELANALGLGLEQNHGFIPHITLAYLPVDMPTPDLRLQPIPAQFADLTLAWGDERRELPLDGDAYGEKSVAFDASTQYASGPGGLFNLPGVERDHEQSMQIIKQANGIYRWNSTSSNNIKDRDGETVSLKALQADVARTKMFGDDDGRVYFYHIPYAVGGAPDYRCLVGGMLVESGEFYDTPVAKAMAEFFIEHPEGIDGSGWGTSVGFMGVPDYTGTYHSVLIHERSVLPLSKAANAYTSFGVKNKMTMTAEQQKALDTVLGDPALIGVVKTALNAQDQSKSADEKGVIRKAAKPAAPAQSTAVIDSANPTPATQTEISPALPVFKSAGRYEATPQAALGFGNVPQPVTKAEGDDTAAAAQADANLAIAQQALAAAQDAVDALGQSEAAEPEAGVVEMAADGASTTAAPESTPAPANTVAPAPVPTKMSDEDMAGIAKWVQETVKKAVGDAVSAMKAEMQGDMQKMEKAFSQQTQVKMLNEVPATLYDRLKMFSTAGAAGIPEKIAAIDETGQPQMIPNPAYIQKGKNLPEAPENQGIMSMLGFGQ